MTAEQWQSALRIYSSARERPSDERRAFIESETPDPEVVQEALDLLESNSESEGARRSSIAPPDRRGGQIGRYEIGPLLGRGGMAEVYAGRDTELDRPVALKFLLADTLGDQAIRRFVREAKAASSLNHPNILTMYEVVRSESGLAIAMELVDGAPLSQFRGEPLACEQVVDLGRQIASALSASHEHGIVHRDIKPENLMLRPDGLVKVLDFGLAREAVAVPAEQTQTTEFGAAAGTPQYMSPEQLRSAPVTGASDVFSLGVVLYEFATGKRPFEAQYAWEAAYAIVAMEPAPPASVSPSIPRALEALILAMLVKDPAARPSAREVAHLLEDLHLNAEQRGMGASAVQSQKRLANRSAGAGWRQAMAVSALALIAVLGLLWYVRMAPRKSPEAVRAVTVHPVTSFEGYKDFGSFSPDGKSIAFSWNGGQGGFSGLQERNIYVLKIGETKPVRLTFAQQDEMHPVWSPDGRYIAFCRMTEDLSPFQRFGIYIIPAAGGTPRKIIDAGEGVSWSPDGEMLAVAGVTPGWGGIFLVVLKTGKRIQLTRSTGYIDALPVFSPNGRWIAFARFVTTSASEIFIVPSHGGPARQLTFDRQNTYGETWTADSKEIIISSNRRSGGESLWRIPISGGTPRQVSAALWGGMFYPSMPPQGDRLLYTESYKDTNIYASHGEGFSGRFAPARFSALTSLIASSRRDDSPNISPIDGRIAFVSKRTGDEEIWVSDRNGGNPKQLTSFGGAGTGTPRWSPDGRWIAFDSRAAGNPNIYVISALGGAPRRLTDAPFGNFMPSWSPDGKRIYFKSDRSGSDQIWWIRAAGGSPTQLTHAGACEAFASPDGKLVYYTKRAWGPIWSVPADGGPEKPVPQLARFDAIRRSWGVTQEGIYFISKQQGPDQIVRFFSFATQKVSPLLTLEREPIWNYPDVALSSDGRTLLIARLDQETNDLMMMENFH